MQPPKPPWAVSPGLAMTRRTADGLTPGAIARLHSGCDASDAFRPLLVVKDIKRLGNDRLRYKLQVADMDYVTPAVAGGAEANSLAQQIQAGNVGVYTVLQLHGSSSTVVAGKPVLYIYAAEVLGPCSEHLRAATQQAWHAAGADDGQTQCTQPASVAELSQAQHPPAPQQQLLQQQVLQRQHHQELQQELRQQQPQPGQTFTNAAAYTTPLKRAGLQLNTATSDITPAPRSAPAQLAQDFAPDKLFSSLNGPVQTSNPAPGGTAGNHGNPYSCFAGASLSTATAPAEFAPAPLGITPASALASPRAAACMPIGHLSPYSPARWKIKARVTLKSDVRAFSNARGEGKLFKVDLRDASGEIQATFFGRAVDANYGRLQQGRVYYFSRGSVKAANRRFDRGDFVITFDEHTVIEDAQEDAEIPGVQYEFKPLTEAGDLPTGTTIDVAAIVSEVREVVTVMLQNGYSKGQERPKRDLILWDASGDEGGQGTHIELTVWGDKALVEYAPDSVVFVKGLITKEWQGRVSLGSGQLTSIQENPDHPHAIQLIRKWQEKGRPGYLPSFAGGGSGSYQPSLTQRKTIESCREDDLRLGPAPVPGQPFDKNAPSSVHKHTALGTIISVQTDRPPFYAACPELVDRPGMQGESRPCQKKVVQDSGSGVWRCALNHECQQPNYRYLCRLQVADDTGALDVSSFDETGVKLFGCEAREIAGLWDSEAHEAELQARLQKPLWRRVVVKLRSQKETFNDEERVKYVLLELANAPHVAEAKRMLGQVREAVGMV